jgi:RNA polymerase sigma factor (sigma-70 family)
MREGTRADSGPSGAAAAGASGAASAASAGGDGIGGVAADESAEVVARTAAYAELYRERNTQLIAYATSLTGNPQVAEDLAAEAHFRVWRRLRAGHEVDNIPAYLTTTVRNLASGLGRAQREIARDWTDLPPETAASGVVTPGFAVGGVAAAGFAGGAAAQDPEQRASHVDLLTRLLKELPDRWATALWCAEVEDLPMESVGARIGASASTAAVVLTRARERLRQAFLQSQPGMPAAEACAEHWKLMPSLVRGTASAHRVKRVTDHTEGCADCRERLLALTDANSRLPLILGPALLAGVLGGGGAWLVPSISGIAGGAGAKASAGVVATRSASVRAGSKAAAARHARVKAGALGHVRSRVLTKSISPAKGVLFGSVGVVGVAAAATALALGATGPHHAAAAAITTPSTATTPAAPANSAGAANASSSAASSPGTAASAAAGRGAGAGAAQAPRTTATQAPQQSALPAAEQTSQSQQATQPPASTQAPTAAASTTSAPPTTAATPTQTSNSPSAPATTPSTTPPASASTTPSDTPTVTATPTVTPTTSGATSVTSAFPTSPATSQSVSPVQTPTSDPASGATNDCTIQIVVVCISY